MYLREKVLIGSRAWGCISLQSETINKRANTSHRLTFLSVLRVECIELTCLMKRTTKNKVTMKSIESKSLEGIPFDLKESNSGHLCPAHFTQLSRLLKKRPIEEVEHVAEPVQFEETSPDLAPVEKTVPESQEEESATPPRGLTPTGNQERAPPQA